MDRARRLWNQQKLPRRRGAAGKLAVATEDAHTRQATVPRTRSAIERRAATIARGLPKQMNITRARTTIDNRVSPADKLTEPGSSGIEAFEANATKPPGTLFYMSVILLKAYHFGQD